MRSGRAASGPRAVWAGWHRPPVRTGSVSSAGGSVAAAAIVCCFCFFGRALLLLVLRFCVRWVWCRCRCHLLLRRRRFGLHVVSVNVTVGGFCSAGRWVLGCCCCLLLFPLHRPCSAWSVCRCRGWAFSLFSAVGGSGAVVAAIRSASSTSVGAVVGLCLWICGRWVRCCCHWLRLLLLRRFCSPRGPSVGAAVGLFAVFVSRWVWCRCLCRLLHRCRLFRLGAVGIFLGSLGWGADRLRGGVVRWRASVYGPPAGLLRWFRSICGASALRISQAAGRGAGSLVGRAVGRIVAATAVGVVGEGGTGAATAVGVGGAGGTGHPV